MKKLFELGDRFASQSDWKDFALTKFCLFSMGIIIGVLIPEKQVKKAAAAAGGVFAATYAVLMAKVFKIAKEMLKGE